MGKSKLTYEEKVCLKNDNISKRDSLNETNTKHNESITKLEEARTELKTERANLVDYYDELYKSILWESDDDQWVGTNRTEVVDTMIPEKIVSPHTQNIDAIDRVLMKINNKVHTLRTAIRNNESEVKRLNRSISKLEKDLEKE